MTALQKFWDHMTALRERAGEASARFLPEGERAAPIADREFSELLVDLGPRDPTPYVYPHNLWAPEHQWIHGLEAGVPNLELEDNEPVHPQIALAAFEYALATTGISVPAMSFILNGNSFVELEARLSEDSAEALDAYVRGRATGLDDSRLSATRYLALMDTLPQSPWRDAERAYAFNFIADFPDAGFDSRALKALDQALDAEDCPAWLLAQAVSQLGPDGHGQVIAGDASRFTAAVTRARCAEIPLKRLLELGWNAPWSVALVDLMESNLDDARDELTDDTQRAAALAYWRQTAEEHYTDDEEEEDDVVGFDEDEPQPSSDSGASLGALLGWEADREFMRTRWGFWPEGLRLRDPASRPIPHRLAAQAAAALVYACRTRETSPETLTWYGLALACCVDGAKESGDLRLLARFALALAEVVSAFEAGWSSFGLLRGHYEDLDAMTGELEYRVARAGMDLWADPGSEAQGAALALTAPPSIAARLRLLGVAAGLLYLPRSELRTSPELPDQLLEDLGAPLPADAVLGGSAGASTAADIEMIQASIAAAVHAALEHLVQVPPKSPMERGRERISRHLPTLVDSSWLNGHRSVFDTFGRFTFETLEEPDTELRQSRIARSCSERATLIEGLLKELLPSAVFEGQTYRDFDIGAFGRALEDGTWDRRFSPHARDVVRTAWPTEREQQTLGRLLDDWRRARNPAVHEPHRALAQSAVNFLLPDLSLASDTRLHTQRSVYDLLRYIVEGGIRLNG